VRGGEESDATIVFDDVPNLKSQSSNFGKGKADFRPLYLEAYLHFPLFGEIARELKERK
jgi:hypothetical protein